MMLQWDLSLFSVSPAADLLSRCVSRGALFQEEIDSASSRMSPVFTSHLHEAEQRIKMQRQLDELELEMQLLKIQKASANITHIFHLARKFQVLQKFCVHLQDILREQNSLRQRLMRPLGRTNLPIQAHLHRSVVDVVMMLLDFIEALEEKQSSFHSWITSRDDVAQLNTSLAQLLTQVVELQTLSNQVLQLKLVGRSLWCDNL